MFFIDKNGNSALRVSEQDYILGIADFTGELMRYCINMVGRHRNEEVNHSKALLQQISAVFGELDFTFLKRKTEELKRSLAKVEKVCYMVKVQQAEFPDINLNIDISNVKFEDDFPKNG
ncbi:hypothetical protein HK099_000200 [Clydaea vesicula]|uniref:Translin n=1 Tax=Clydaea vesicula TaxID=447962 RepID=A0AAD5TUZ1_9FUNG|nr:hypothetical protein HK099_000200 [Clydaea vesicula]